MKIKWLVNMRNKEKYGGFVAISDFHSNRWTLEKIKYYLNEHDIIYILGDATDRVKLKMVKQEMLYQRSYLMHML